MTWSWGRRGSVCLWEISLYSHSVITEVCVCDRVCVFLSRLLKECSQDLFGASGQCPLRDCLKTLHPENTHTHTHSSCTQFAQHTLTNSSLTRSNTTWHKHHNPLLPFSLVCPSFPNTEMSVLASKPVSPLHSISVRIMTLLLLLFVLKQPSIYTQQSGDAGLCFALCNILCCFDSLSLHTPECWHDTLCWSWICIPSSVTQTEMKKGGAKWEKRYRQGMWN